MEIWRSAINGCLRLATCLLLILTFCAATRKDQEAWMVWDSGCIQEFSKQLDTRLEAPMVDGEPDIKQLRIIHSHVKYDQNCGHIEVRKVK